LPLIIIITAMTDMYDEPKQFEGTKLNPYPHSERAAEVCFFFF